MNKIVLSSFILFVIFQLFGQTRELRHYQRNAQLKEVIIPSISFSADAFGILFPDSLYDVATITLRKVRIIDSKLKFAAQLKSEEKTFSQIQYFFKNIKQLRGFLDRLNAILGAKITTETDKECLFYNSKNVLITISKKRRQYAVFMILKDC